MNTFLSVMAIFFPLALMIILIWKKVHMVIIAPICAGLMALLSGLPVLESLTGDYMSSFAGYVQSYFLLIILGAIFSKLMEASGASKDVAELLAKKVGSQHAILLVIFTAVVLCYGGVSFYVAAFAIYPIALVLFQKADLPKTLIPGAIAAGAFTAPNLLPGAPSVMNIIPMNYLGTSASCAPVIAIVDSVVLVGLCSAYMVWQGKRAHARGEHFVPDAKALATLAEYEKIQPGNGWIGLIPLVTVIGLLLLKVNVLIALSCGIIVIFALYWKKINNKLTNLAAGVGDGMAATVATSAAVGFGGVVAVTAGYQALVNFATNLGGPPLASFAISTGILAGACGSGSGGMAMALNLLKDHYLALGVAPEAMHKVASIAGLTLDSLPHNGVMVTLLAVCGVTHSEGYKHIFACTVVCTTITTIVAVILGTIMF